MPLSRLGIGFVSIGCTKALPSDNLLRKQDFRCGCFTELNSMPLSRNRLRLLRFSERWGSMGWKPRSRANNRVKCWEFHKVLLRVVQSRQLAPFKKARKFEGFGGKSRELLEKLPEFEGSIEYPLKTGEGPGNNSQTAR